MSTGSLFLGLGILWLSQISALWQLFASFCLIAMGGSCYLIPLTSTVARWFVKRRGMMVSLLISALGTCELVMPPFARFLISSYGWRQAYIILGLMVFLVIVLAAQFIRRDPSKMGSDTLRRQARKTGQCSIADRWAISSRSRAHPGILDI